MFDLFIFGKIVVSVEFRPTSVGLFPWLTVDYINIYFWKRLAMQSNSYSHLGKTHFSGLWSLFSELVVWYKMIIAKIQINLSANFT